MIYHGGSGLILRNKDKADYLKDAVRALPIQDPEPFLNVSEICYIWPCLSVVLLCNWL